MVYTIAAMASNVATLPPLHSKRVEAWIYTVINPLIENLRREVFLLGKGNLSWRWYSRKSKFIRPVDEYVYYEHRPNYEDFVGDGLNPGFAHDFERHDGAVSLVESEARHFYEQLLHNPRFNNQVVRSLNEYERTVAEDPQRQSLTSVRDNLPKHVAEYMINKTLDLPAHYISEAFWEEYRSRFLETDEGRFIPSDERDSYKSLDEASSTLYQLSTQVLSRLEAHRSYLSTTFDVPFAPIQVNQPSRRDGPFI